MNIVTTEPLQQRWLEGRTLDGVGGKIIVILFGEGGSHSKERKKTGQTETPMRD
jgi:hypothetical protein